MALCLYVCLCLSVTSQCSVKRNERSNLVLGTAAFFDQSYTVFQGKSGIYKNKGTFLWNFALNSGLRKFRMHVDRQSMSST